MLECAFFEHEFLKIPSVELTYCWWMKSCTTWDVIDPGNNDININYLSTGAGFLPSTVSSEIGLPDRKWVIFEASISFRVPAICSAQLPKMAAKAMPVHGMAVRNNRFLWPKSIPHGIAQSPKGRLIQGLYEPIQGNCAIYFCPGPADSVHFRNLIVVLHQILRFVKFSQWINMN